MNNFRAVRKYRRLRRNRRRLENFGMFLIGLGFLILVAITGVSSLPLIAILGIALGGCGVMGLGLCVVNYCEMLKRKYPLKLRLIEKDGELCYNIHISK